MYGTFPDYAVTNMFFIFYFWDRFKDHIQNNNPKHFLSQEEFVQLRLELAAANKPSGEGEEETPTEELPPGTEDLPDPAKVRAQTSICGYETCQRQGGTYLMLERSKTVQV